MTPEILQERRWNVFHVFVICQSLALSLHMKQTALAHRSFVLVSPCTPFLHTSGSVCHCERVRSAFSLCLPNANRKWSSVRWEDVFGKPLCHADLHRTINWVYKQKL